MILTTFPLKDVQSPHPDIDLPKAAEMANRIIDGYELPPIMIKFNGEAVSGTHRIAANRMLEAVSITCYLLQKYEVEKLNMKFGDEWYDLAEMERYALNHFKITSKHIP